MSTFYRTRSYSSPNMKHVSSISRDVTQELHFYKTGSTRPQIKRSKSFKKNKLHIEKMEQLKNIEDYVEVQIEKKLSMIDHYGGDYETKYEYFNDQNTIWGSIHSGDNMNRTSSSRGSTRSETTRNILSSSKTTSAFCSFDESKISRGSDYLFAHDVSTDTKDLESIVDVHGGILDHVFNKINRNFIREYSLETHDIRGIIKCYLSYMKDAHSVYKEYTQERAIALERANDIYNIIMSDIELYQGWRTYLFEEINAFIKNTQMNI
jgi:hypothetical protein